MHTIRITRPPTLLAVVTAAAVALAVAIAGGLLATGAAADEHEATADVTLLHDTHFHGNFSDDHATIAEYFGLAQELKDAHEHALFLGNGDDIAPSLLSAVFRGEHMIDALNVAPIDYNTFGNHEFDYGPEQLEHLLEMTDPESFGWVSANVRDADDEDEVFGADLGAELFAIEDMGGVQVGITGLGPRHMDGITSLDGQAIEVPYLEAMDEVVPQMYDAGADIIVVASHLNGNDARILADERDDVHAIVGDHAAEVLEEPEERNGTIVSLLGHEFEWMGELTLEVVDGDVDGFEFTRHSLDELDPEPIPELQAIMDDYESQLDEELNVVIGERTVDWDTRVEIVRQRETAVGNFLTDAYADGLDADIGLQNGGGIRGDRIYEAGDITRREIQEILPFDNRMNVVEIPGERLYDLLDEIVTSDGIRMQLSGLQVVFESGAPEGERVIDAWVGCEPIEDDATYTLATLDFLADGSSGMDGILDDLPKIIDSDAGPLNSAFITEYIEDMDEPVTTDRDGRMHQLDADFDQPEPLCEDVVEPPPDELPSIDFADIPGNVQPGRTLPVRFTVEDDGEPVQPDGLVVRVTSPDGDEATLTPKRAGARFQVNVRTFRDQPGDYEVAVFDEDGNELGTQTISTR